MDQSRSFGKNKQTEERIWSLVQPNLRMVSDFEYNNTLSLNNG